MDLKGRHIFRVGTWNGQTFTEQDLDDIVRNFEELRAEHHVPLKFGHNKEQPVTDGQPAIGWIERVYRDGKDLFADFSHVPKVVMDLIRSRRFRTVSIEVLKNAKFNGKAFKSWVLDAVALLGADQPAVSGLKDLADLALSRASVEDGQCVVFSKAGNFLSETEEREMDQKDLDAAIDRAMAPLRDSLEKKDAQIAELTKKLETSESVAAELKSKTEQREKEEKAQKIEASRKAATEILDTAVKQQGITPAQREILEKSFGVKDDERVVAISLDDLKVAANWSKPKGAPGSTTFSRNEDENMSDEPLDVQVVTATRKVQANKPDLSYTQAQAIALQANPKLAREYLDSNGTFNADGGVSR